MAFGKSNQSHRRHRPKKSDEIVEDDRNDDEEDKMNSALIPTVITLVGSVLMFGIVVMGAPYSYGSQKVHYTKGSIKEAQTLSELGKKERKAADPKLLIDFTTIVTPPNKAPTEAMKTVAQTCRQGRASTLEFVTPEKVHRAFRKATKFLNCAMATEPGRFCAADERKRLAEQLMAYKEKRQNVLAYETYLDKEVARWEGYRELKKSEGLPDPGPLKLDDTRIPEAFDPTLLSRLETLVRNGYLSPSDFGYFGLYVPTEYRAALSVGADRYAVCGAPT